MASVQRVGDLEIGQDLDFQRHEWTVQRVGWAVMALIVVAALLGLFATGPLSDASAERGPLRLGYGRFERKASPAKLRVEVAAGTAPQGELRLWLNEKYLDGIKLQTISPEPDQVLAGADRTVYVFQVDDPDQPANVGFEFEPVEFGTLTGRLGLVDGPEIEFTHLVYP